MALNQGNSRARIPSHQRRSQTQHLTDKPTPRAGGLAQRPAWLSHSPRSVDFVFFDLETTGGNPSNSEVIEIAAIKEKDGKEIGRFQSLINPRRHIPRPVREITGIDQSMVRNAPLIEDVIDEFLEFIGDGVLVSHGVLNDFSFVAHYARTLRGKELSNFYVCTHLIVSNFLPNVPVKSLSGVANYFGLSTGNAHRAMADAEMTRSVFWEINKVCEKNGFKSLEDLLKIQADNQTLSRLGPGLLSQHVERAPSTPGLLYLFNSSREVTYTSATPNIRRSLMNVTELSDERDFNRLLVDVTDFKFERSAHFLAALLQEKKELKKLELSVDPRKFEGRADNILQILLPEDLLDYWQANPAAIPLKLPDRGSVVQHNGLMLSAASDASLEDIRANVDEISHQERNQYVYAHLTDSKLPQQKVPIRKTKRIINAVKNPKYKMSRTGDAKKTCAHFGHLQSGFGWHLGPVEQPKVMRKRVDELLTLWPFHDKSIAPQERAEYFNHFYATLTDNIDAEIERIARQKNNIKNIFNPLARKRFSKEIELLKALRSEGYSFPKHTQPKTGIAVVTNTDSKELDVAVVVNSRIRQFLRLPVEDGDKLRSSRFFTRLMAPYHDEIINKMSCNEYTEDVCADIELFSHWLSKRRGEGEWVDFETLEPLYNPHQAE